MEALRAVDYFVTPATHRSVAKHVGLGLLVFVLCLESLWMFVTYGAVWGLLSLYLPVVVFIAALLWYTA